jgi:hypothetical protein
MAESFVTPESDRTNKLYSEARSPQELFEIAMRELHEHHATMEPSAPTQQSTPSARVTPMSERPQQWRADEIGYAVLYKGNSRIEVVEPKEKFSKVIEDLHKQGWVG